MAGHFARGISSRVSKCYLIEELGSVNLCWLTRRALDAGESARFLGIFHASAFFSVDGFAVPAPAQVTPAVGL